MTSDVRGNAYVASSSYVNSNDGESFVTKVDPNGRVIYHVPGAGGIPDKGGNLYSVPLNQRSACATKLDPDGNSLYRFCLPAPFISAFAVGPDGSAYFAGSWYPDQVTTTPGAWIPSGRASPNKAQPFVMRLNPAGDRLVYSTFVSNAPPMPPALTTVSAIAVDAAGAAYVVGTTDDPGFPATPGTLQTVCGCTPNQQSNLFVAKLSADGGSLFFWTFLDEAAPEVGFRRLKNNVASAALEESGNLRIVLRGDPVTLSAKLLTPDGRLLSSGSAPLTGAMLTAIAPFDSSSFLLTGAAMPDFPLSPGAFQTGDTFVAIARPSDGAILYSTRLPYGAESAFFPGSSLVASDGNGGFLVLHGTGRSATVATWLLARFTPAVPPRIAVFGMQNAAESEVSSKLAPGEVVNIFGEALGPEQPASATFDSAGRLPRNLAGTEILINGIPAPILHASSRQVTAIVPFRLAGAATAIVVVRRNGEDGNPMHLPVGAAEPEILHGATDAAGLVYAAALNEDGAINCQAGLADPGSLMTIFLNGAGMLTPTPDDGAMGRVGERTVLTITAAFRHHHMGNVPVEILYAGAAPGLVAGVTQVNFRLPPPPGPPAGPGQITVSVDGQSTSTVNICINH